MFFPFVSWYFNISTRKGKQKKENQITKKTKVLSDESKYQAFEPNEKVFGTLHKVLLT
jgi:hypothetical protein